MLGALLLRRPGVVVQVRLLGPVDIAADGDAGAARRAWAQALPVLEEIDHADASRVRAKLSSQVSPGPARAHPIPAAAGNSLAHAPGGAASTNSP